MDELTYEEWCAISHAVADLAKKYDNYGVNLRALQDKLIVIADALTPEGEED